MTSDKPASALCAGSYSLTSVLPTAPDMAQFKQGVRSVAGKLSVFANGVMTSIQVSEMGTPVTEFDTLKFSYIITVSSTLCSFTIKLQK